MHTHAQAQAQASTHAQPEKAQAHEHRLGVQREAHAHLLTWSIGCSEAAAATVLVDCCGSQHSQHPSNTAGRHVTQTPKYHRTHALSAYVSVSGAVKGLAAPVLGEHTGTIARLHAHSLTFKREHKTVNTTIAVSVHVLKSQALVNM